MIRAVIFDLDGVITETSRQHFQAWKAVAYMIGVEIDSTVNESLKGVSREESLKIILKYGGILDKYSKEEMEKLCFCKNEYYKQLISQFTPANVFEGVVEMFEYLRGKGIKIAIGSASHNAPALISAMALEPYIDYIVDPGDVKRGKPAPDIFLKAASALGVKPSECIGVEDAVAGVEAIKAAGMYAIGIGDAEVLKEADVVFGSIAEIDLGIIA
ncbi:beta-phosphoglucomutase [Geosporobacter ferrireducens]|uniref:Beta-phosphoglucomutase n=1 Tax=Geosporobacter ferrireducens TaxID=1424294 RepID=A0A1D8GEI6_9FIRM|nr:beta-phosphoglucomutase [Geosporobacter ferrireducens]AOT69300.1 beta-phosphoglucomutase [Geosporobacter ferrireducens]